MQADRQDRIRERAYQIWLAEGRIEGRHDEHWQRAEREIAEEEAGARPGRVRSAGSKAAATPKAPRRRRAAAPKK
jgi:Protein of unknown function (DUF2934)